MIVHSNVSRDVIHLDNQWYLCTLGVPDKSAIHRCVRSHAHLFGLDSWIILCERTIARGPESVCLVSSNVWHA